MYRYGRPSRWMYPNRYDSPCVRCAQRVSAGTGEYRFDGAQWVVRHAGGRCHTVLYTSYVSMESAAWREVRRVRLEYAGHRCEWKPLFRGRCETNQNLECHHRHYRNLGAEPLRDLIILCHEHHVIADDRRRTWGSWPLFGGPRHDPRGEEFDSGNRARPSAQSTTGTVSPAQYCGSCGARNQGDSVFCHSCGKKLRSV